MLFEFEFPYDWLQDIAYTRPLAGRPGAVPPAALVSRSEGARHRAKAIGNTAKQGLLRGLRRRVEGKSQNGCASDPRRAPHRILFHTKIE
jgi:hypothetical protein